MPDQRKEKKSLKENIRTIIFGTETPLGKWFDIILLVLILVSLLTVTLESVDGFDKKLHTWFVRTEWILTVFFTVEYILRIYSTRNVRKYAFSFYGIIDLLSILPTYLSLVLINSKYFLVIRTLRLLRIFRIFKLVRFLKGSEVIYQSIRASLPKIIVFLSFLVICVSILGTVMYVLESNHPESGFSNIPLSIYWAIVTITTVGYGDISPVTTLGRFLASILMILGYAVIAVPTGIVGAEIAKMSNSEKTKNTSRKCDICDFEESDPKAKFCRNCGAEL